jgi:hypothetical protein
MVLAEPHEPQLRLGKGQKRGRKKEAMVTSVYTIAAHPRTPQAVVASFFQQSQTDPTPKKQTHRDQPQLWFAKLHHR